MSAREEFEKIWPIPDGVCWADGYGEYMPMNRHSAKHSELACEWDNRLDTFTRCQARMFSKEEINLFRQWFNAVEDLSPGYIEKSDCDLYRKVLERLK